MKKRREGDAVERLANRRGRRRHLYGRCPRGGRRRAGSASTRRPRRSASRLPACWKACGEGLARRGPGPRGRRLLRRRLHACGQHDHPALGRDDRASGDARDSRDVLEIRRTRLPDAPPASKRQGPVPLVRRAHGPGGEGSASARTAPSCARWIRIPSCEGSRNSWARASRPWRSAFCISYINPAHEQAAQAVIAERWPGSVRLRVVGDVAPAARIRADARLRDERLRPGPPCAPITESSKKACGAMGIGCPVADHPVQRRGRSPSTRRRGYPCGRCSRGLLRE